MGRVWIWLLHWSPLLSPIVLILASACISNQIATQQEEDAHARAKLADYHAQTNRTLQLYDTYLSLDAIQELVIRGSMASDMLETRLETANRESRYQVARQVFEEITQSEIRTIRASAEILLDAAETIYQCGWQLADNDHLSCNKQLIASIFGKSILPAFFGLRHLYYCDQVISKRYFRNGNPGANVYMLETIILEHLNGKFSGSGERTFVRTHADRANGSQNSLRPDVEKLCE